MEAYYEHATYIKLTKEPRKGAEARIHSIATPNLSHASFCFAFMIEEHNLDWSGEEPPSSNNTEVTALATTVSDELEYAFTGRVKTLDESIISNELLSLYKKANVCAERSGITVSLLNIFILDRALYVASVGACKIYLVRHKKVTQMNIDDYCRTNIEGELRIATGCLSNILGMGKVESVNDIHLKQYVIRPEDHLLLCNQSFHQNVSENEIIQAMSLSSDVNDLCSSLAEKVIPRLRILDSLALCLIKVQ